jgi:hypothetical protein
MLLILYQGRGATVRLFPSLRTGGRHFHALWQGFSTRESNTQAEIVADAFECTLAVNGIRCYEFEHSAFSVRDGLRSEILAAIHVGMSLCPRSPGYC